MPSADEVALDHYDKVQSYVDSAAFVAGRAWDQVDPDHLVDSWVQQLPALTQAVAGAQYGAAAQADGYVDDALDAQDLATGSVAPVAPDAFAGVASDGRGLASLMTNPVIQVLTSIPIPGMTVPKAMAAGRANLDMLVRTQVSDAGRLADQVSLTAHPGADGYVRLAVGGSCNRCLVLAGKFYRWNAGFSRHPRCDCKHVPAQEAGAKGLIRDPYEIYRSMSARERLRAGFSLGDQRALAEGADIFQVVNARRGMYTAGGRSLTREGTTRRALFGGYEIDPETGRILARRAKGAVVPPRLTPDQIFATAETRADALRMLHENGYLSERPSAALSEADRLQLGQRESIQLASTPAGSSAVPGAPLQVRQALAAAETPEQVSRALEAEYRRITGRDLTAEFAGSVETAREHAEGVLRAVEQHPDIRLSRVSTGRMAKSKSYAETYVGEQEIVFSDRWSSVERRQQYLEALAGDERAGWHAAGTGHPLGVAAHEMGHLFDVASSALDEDVARLLFAAQQQTGVQLERAVRLGVSGYATTSRRELMAEAFSDVVTNGERASGLSRAVVRSLEEHRGVDGGVIVARGPLASAPKPPTLAALRKQVTGAGITVPVGAPRAVVENLVDALERGVAPARAREAAVREMFELRQMVGDKRAQTAAALENDASERAMAYYARQLRRLSSGEGGLGYPTRAVPELGKPLQGLIDALERGDAAAAKAALPKAVTGSKLKALGQPGAVISRSKLGADLEWVGAGRGDVVEVLHPGYVSTLEGKTLTVTKPSIRSATPEQAQAFRTPAKKAAAPARPAGRIPSPAETPPAAELARARSEIGAARGLSSYETGDYAGSSFLSEFRGKYPSTYGRLVQDVRIEADFKTWAAGQAGTPAAVRAALERHMREQLAGTHVVVRQTEAQLRGVLGAGRFKTQFEVRRSTGAYDPRRRAEYERMTWGYAEDLDPKLRPVYAYLDPPDLDESAWHAYFDAQARTISTTSVREIGGVRVVLKDEVRGRSTFTVGDSLESAERARPSAMSDPHWQSYQFRDGPPLDADWMSPQFQRQVQYVEAQVHGGVRVEDIAEVIFDREPVAATTAALDRAGVRWRVEARPTKAAPAKAAAPDLTGAKGLSTDPAVREVQIENRIREAYMRAPKNAIGGVELLDLREQLGDSISRAEVDAALQRMGRRRGMSLIPNENLKEFTLDPRGPAMREAAVRIGPQNYHTFEIEPGYRDLKPLPAKAAPVKKAAAPRVPKPPAPAKMSLPALRTELDKVMERAGATADLATVPKQALADMVTRARALPAAELKAEVGRWRQVVIDRRRDVADLLSQADQLLDAEATAAVLGQRGASIVRRWEQAAQGWPDLVEARKVVAAMQTGDPAKVRRAIAAARKKLGLEQIGADAGAVARYDRTVMSPISGAKIADDAHVVVVRPGYRMADGTVLSKPVVEEATTQEVAAATAPKGMPSRGAGTFADIERALDSFPKEADFATREEYLAAHEKWIARHLSPVVDGEYAGGIRIRPSEDAGFYVAIRKDGSLQQIYFSGDLMRNGRKVGSAIRRIERDRQTGELVADHAYLEISRTLRGSGFAKEFNDNLIEWYRRSGVKRVELVANIDVGGYAWARAGFDFASAQATSDFLGLAEEKIAKALARTPRGLTRQQVLDLKQYLADVRAGKIPAHAADIADFGRAEGQAGKAAIWPGKWLMLGHDIHWAGVMYL